MMPIDMLAAEMLDRQRYTSDRIAELHARVKRLQRLVVAVAYDGIMYTDPGSIVSADDDTEKQSEYELARRDCEEHGDIEGES